MYIFESVELKMYSKRSSYCVLFVVSLFCVGSKAIETAQQLPHPDPSIIHELDGAQNVIKSFPDSKDNQLQIFCRNADSKNLLNYFRTAKLRLLSTSEDINIITGLSPPEVYYKYLSSTKWFNWATNLLPWRVREASFPTFNRSCVGVSTTKQYDVNLIIRPIDPWNLALLVTGIGLFWSAPNLVRSTTFFYGSGTAIGALASALVVIFIVYRTLPKNKFSYTTIAAIWSVSLYFAGESYSRFEELVQEKLPYVLVYLTTGALIALITCYRVGQPSHPKTLDILKWLLQLFSVWLIHMSSEFIEMSTAIIVILVVSYYFGRRLRLTSRQLWMRMFPPKPRLLTLDEYETQGREHTRKSLIELREFCSSPECKPWKIASRLKNPSRFSSFLEGEEHIQDDELENYGMDDDVLGDSDSLNELDSEEEAEAITPSHPASRASLAATGRPSVPMSGGRSSRHGTPSSGLQNGSIATRTRRSPRRLRGPQSPGARSDEFWTDDEADAPIANGAHTDDED